MKKPIKSNDEDIAAEVYGYAMGMALMCRQAIKNPENANMPFITEGESWKKNLVPIETTLKRIFPTPDLQCRFILCINELAHQYFSALVVNIGSPVSKAASSISGLRKIISKAAEDIMDNQDIFILIKFAQIYEAKHSIRFRAKETPLPEHETTNATQDDLIVSIFAAIVEHLSDMIIRKEVPAIRAVDKDTAESRLLELLDQHFKGYESRKGRAAGEKLVEKPFVKYISALFEQAEDHLKEFSCISEKEFIKMLSSSLLKGLEFQDVLQVRIYNTMANKRSVPAKIAGIEGYADNLPKEWAESDLFKLELLNTEIGRRQEKKQPLDLDKITALPDYQEAQLIVLSANAIYRSFTSLSKGRETDVTPP